MPNHRVRIKPGYFHGHDGRHKAGDEIIVTALELTAFGDKFIDLGEQQDAQPAFELTDKISVDDIMAAVAAGLIEAEEVVAFEQARSRPRKTLLSQLEAQLEALVLVDEDEDEG